MVLFILYDLFLFHVKIENYSIISIDPRLPDLIVPRRQKPEKGDRGQKNRLGVMQRQLSN